MQTSESVGKGHPDKMCDIISDSILDEAITKDPKSRVAVETWVKDNSVGLIGEITTSASIDYEQIIRKTIKEIGYSDESWGINPDTCKLYNFLGEQSSEISQGVDVDGAGDQGIMWGYATDETKEFLPLSQVLSNELLKKTDQLRSQYTFLRPDMKSQVTIDNGKIHTIIMAVQHSKEISEQELKEFLKKEVINPVCKDYLKEDTKIIINGTGAFTIGGPKGDAGLTGRKIIVDTYGGIGRHGGGAFSGKDPTKVDRSAAYMARYIAKNIVGSGVAKEAEVQLGYCIGVSDPVSVKVIVDGKENQELALKVKQNFPLNPSGIINHLSLRNPNGWQYKKTASFGHFGRSEFPWEKLDKVDVFKSN